MSFIKSRFSPSNVGNGKHKKQRKQKPKGHGRVRRFIFQKDENGAN